MHINTQTLTNVFPRSTSAHVSTAWFCSTQGSIFSSGFTASVKGTWFSWPRHGLSPPTQYIIVANEGLFIRIPDPKHVMSSWWWLEPGKSGKADITPTNHPVDLRQELVLPKPSRPKPTIHPAFPSVSPAAQCFWKCPFWMGNVWTYAYILHHIINTYH